MKKILLAVILTLTFSVVAYSQTSRPATTNYPGKGNFTQLGVQGLNVDGNPGYIEIAAEDGNGATVLYYLWVDFTADGTGDLMIASGPSLTAYSSFPNGDWRSGIPLNASGISEKVGAQ